MTWHQDGVGPRALRRLLQALRILREDTCGYSGAIDTAAVIAAILRCTARAHYWSRLNWSRPNTPPIRHRLRASRYNRFMTPGASIPTTGRSAATRKIRLLPGDTQRPGGRKRSAAS
jgi:hypothetical protein